MLRDMEGEIFTTVPANVDINGSESLTIEELAKNSRDDPYRAVWYKIRVPGVFNEDINVYRSEPDVTVKNWSRELAVTGKPIPLISTP